MFSKKNDQVIKFDQNVEGISADEKGVLFVRVRGEVYSKEATFEVPESHIAYVIKGGGDKRFYQSGTYDVFDDKKDVKAWKKGSNDRYRLHPEGNKPDNSLGYSRKIQVQGLFKQARS